MAIQFEQIDRIERALIAIVKRLELIEEAIDRSDEMTEMLVGVGVETAQLLSEIKQMTALFVDDDPVQEADALARAMRVGQARKVRH